MKSTDLRSAVSPLVLAIDVGSSSVRALLFDASGAQILNSETQLTHVPRTTSDGGAEVDPEELITLVVACIDGVLTLAGKRAAEIAAVAQTSFWHGMLGVDTAGRPTTPVLMWSDKRSAPDVATLLQRFDLNDVHRQTGCRLHSSYWPAKITWLQRVHPEVVARTARWLSFADLLCERLTGETMTSISMASGTGLLDAETLCWQSGFVAALGINQDALPPIIDRRDALPVLLPEWANRWEAIAAARWFPAIGDGAAANVGSGCVGQDRVAITIGTSAAMRVVLTDEMVGTVSSPISNRIWRYRLDRSQMVLGGALSNGGNVTGWLADRFADGEFAHLARDAEAIDADSHGLTVLPFLAGERSPSWNDAATGTLSGIRLSTTAADIFRATLEATAYRIADIHDDLRPLIAGGYEIHANGAAVLASPLWLQIIADTLGHQIDAIDADAEASAMGTAVCALEAIGVLDNLEAFRHDVSREFESDADRHDLYVSARQRQRALERAIYGATW